MAIKISEKKLSKDKLNKKKANRKNNIINLLNNNVVSKVEAKKLKKELKKLNK